MFDLVFWNKIYKDWEFAFVVRLEGELCAGFSKGDGNLYSVYSDEERDIGFIINSQGKSRGGVLEELAEIYDSLGVCFEPSDICEIGSLGSKYHDLSYDEQVVLVMGNFVLSVA